jgi:hypothetical protein
VQLIAAFAPIALSTVCVVRFHVLVFFQLSDLMQDDYFFVLCLGVGLHLFFLEVGVFAAGVTAVLRAIRQQKLDSILLSLKRPSDVDPITGNFDADGACAICMEEMKSSSIDDVIVTECRHVFHRFCLATWLPVERKRTIVKHSQYSS